MTKVIIIGSGQDSKSALLLLSMKEKFGNDIILMTPDEAKEKKISEEDIFIEKIKITKFPEEVYRDTSMPLSGKENRRKRREQERKKFKK